MLQVHATLGDLAGGVRGSRAVQRPYCRPQPYRPAPVLPLRIGNMRQAGCAIGPLVSNLRGGGHKSPHRRQIVKSNAEAGKGAH